MDSFDDSGSFAPPVVYYLSFKSGAVFSLIHKRVFRHIHGAWKKQKRTPLDCPVIHRGYDGVLPADWPNLGSAPTQCHAGSPPSACGQILRPSQRSAAVADPCLPPELLGHTQRPYDFSLRPGQLPLHGVV